LERHNTKLSLLYVCIYMHGNITRWVGVLKMLDSQDDEEWKLKGEGQDVVML